MPVADLSAVVWAADGLKGTPDAMSSASKAGGTFPVSGDINYVNLYVLSAKGVYRYVPETNTLKQVDGKDARAAVTSESIAPSAFMLLFTYDAGKLPSFVKGNAARGQGHGRRHGELRRRKRGPGRRRSQAFVHSDVQRQRAGDRRGGQARKGRGAAFHNAVRLHEIKVEAV